MGHFKLHVTVHIILFTYMYLCVCICTYMFKYFPSLGEWWGILITALKHSKVYKIYLSLNSTAFFFLSLMTTLIWESELKVKGHLLCIKNTKIK